MYDNYLAKERATALHRAAQERRLARQIATAHRWARIAVWAQARARRANSQIG